MSILTASVIVASALASPSYQAAAQAGPQNLVTVSGCVAQAPRTGSLVSETVAPAPATPNTAGIEANSNEPSNAFVLLDATPIKRDSAAGAPDRRTSYALQGRDAELANHRGHRVEIVGSLTPARAGAPGAGETPQRIAVKSIKMLNTQCSAAGAPRRGE